MEKGQPIVILEAMK
ncbi:hypothetical protein MJ575_26205 [Klebsiella pneumoniae]|nr:hypothetical protein MJ575_26205 [Klebsiella pneumoniae]